MGRLRPRRDSSGGAAVPAADFRSTWRRTGQERHHDCRPRKPRVGDAAASAGTRARARTGRGRQPRTVDRARWGNLARADGGAAVNLDGLGRRLDKLDHRDRLAVVVPVFNEAAGIRPTLEALAAQDDADFDVVFVDNASTDASADVIREFAASRSLTRWRVITESQKGTGAAADTGMRDAIAHGATLLARTDADCLPRADWTAAVRRSLTTDGLGLVGGELVPRHDEGLSLWRRVLLRGPSNWPRRSVGCGRATGRRSTWART